MSTLLLTRSDVVRNLQALTLLADMREALRAEALARTVAPQWVRVPLHAQATAQVLFPGSLPGVPAYTVRVEAHLPSSTPPRRTVVQLHDLATGALLAVMDAAHLTAVCTGVVGALGADVLARPEASRVALLGAGGGAALQLKSLRLVRTLSQAFVHDVDFARAVALAARLYQELSLPARPVASAAEAVAQADIIVAEGAAGHGALSPELLGPGAHLTLLGAEAAEGAELPAALLERALFVCDHRGRAAARGAAGGLGVPESACYAELGEVLAGLRPGRASPEQLTAFGRVGAPPQDLAAAWHVYQTAREDEAVRRVDFDA